MSKRVDGGVLYTKVWCTVKGGVYTVTTLNPEKPDDEVIAAYKEIGFDVIELVVMANLTLFIEDK